MLVKVLEGTDELIIRSDLHGAHQDNIAVIFEEDKKLFVYPVGCYWELSSEVGNYHLLGIDDTGKDLVGACIQFIYRCLLWWSWIRCSHRMDILLDLLHVSFCIGHGWWDMFHEFHC